MTERKHRCRAVLVSLFASLTVLSGCGAALEASGAASAEALGPSGAAVPRALPLPQAAPSDASTVAGTADTSAADASAAALLVYEATVTLGVYQVAQAVATVAGIARQADGHVVLRDDSRVVFRVPRARFDEALAHLDGVGDVIHRDVRAEDVGDRYRDLDVRLRNSRAVRDRLEQLLAKATSVDDSLKIESQLSRVTEEIERLSGEIKLLGARVQYSKITVLFQARHVEEVHDEVLRLPFPWLGALGLSNLLELRESHP